MAQVLTRTGKNMLSTRLRLATPWIAEPLVLAWGLNPNFITGSATDVALFSEWVGSTMARVSGTSTIISGSVTGDTYQVSGTMTASGSATICEAGLVDTVNNQYSTIVTGTTSPATVAAGASSITGTTTANTILYTTQAFTPYNPGPTYLQIRGEVLQITGTAVSGIFTGVQRAQNGSTATATIANGDAIGVGNTPQLALFTTGTSAAPVIGGNTFAHADFGAISLNNGDSIQFTWQVKFT
jgi:hypothetical protein